MLLSCVPQFSLKIIVPLTQKIKSVKIFLFGYAIKKKKNSIENETMTSSWL